MPQVSVVIPTYNRASLIGETLDSVEAQTFTDWECLVIDDGSSDNTREVVEAYCARDPRFRYARHENTETRRDYKVIAVRNKGLALAKGDLIAFLDDDDVWLPGYLEAATTMLAARPDVRLSACPRLFWDGERIVETQQFLPGQLSQPLRGMIRNCFLVPSQCVIRRAAIERTPLFRVPGSEDYDLWLQILPPRPASAGVGFVAEPLVKYRIHAGSSLLDPTGEKGHRLAERHMQVLHNFLQRREISPFDRLLALGNLQRKHEQILEMDIRGGRISHSHLARLSRLLGIFPTPLLRNPSLARKYLTYKPLSVAAPQNIGKNVSPTGAMWLPLPVLGMIAVFLVLVTTFTLYQFPARLFFDTGLHAVCPYGLAYIILVALLTGFGGRRLGFLTLCLALIGALYLLPPRSTPAVGDAIGWGELGGLLLLGTATVLGVGTGGRPPA